MWMTRLLITGVALGAGTAAVAQDYFDFGRIPGLPDQAAIQIDLDPVLLGFVSRTAGPDVPAAADLLEGVDGVRVQVYKALDAIGDIAGFIDAASVRLERANWQRVVSVQDESQARVYVRTEGESVTGVTAMIVHHDNVVLVNIAGAISPQQLGQAIASFNTGTMLSSLGGISLVD